MAQRRGVEQKRADRKRRARDKARAQRSAEEKRRQRWAAEDRAAADYELAVRMYRTGDEVGSLALLEERCLRGLAEDQLVHRFHLHLLGRTGATRERALAPLRALHDLGCREHQELRLHCEIELDHGDPRRAAAVLETFATVPGVRRTVLTRLRRAVERALAARPVASPAPPPPVPLPAPPAAPASSAPAPAPREAREDAAEDREEAARETTDVVRIEARIEGIEPLAKRLDETAWDSLAAFNLSLEAHGLAAQDRFDELLCLDLLHGVERFWYQVETARRVMRTFRGRVILADEVGLGKTIEAGMVLKEYLLRGLVETALILVPPTIVGQWRGELAAKFGIDAGGSDDPGFRSDPDAYLDAHPIAVLSLAAARRGEHQARLSSRRFDLAIVDEAHRIKDHRTKGHRLVADLKSRFLLLLTATPVETDLMELYNLVTLLRPGQLSTRKAFRDRFMERGDPTAPRNRDRLRSLLREVMVRNTRALAGTRLPPRFAATVIAEPLPDEAQLYARCVALVRAEPQLAPLLVAAGSSPAALVRWAERRAPSHPELATIVRQARQLATTRKDEHLLELVRQADKTVVFTQSTATLEHVAGGLERHGIDAVTFHGGLGAGARSRVVEAFTERAQVLVSTEVGSEGLNLQFAANLVNYDLPWNPMRIEQRIGRLHRIGQRREVRVWNLCTRGAAEERLLDVLDRRLNLFELVVGEIDMVLGYMTDETDLEALIGELYGRARSDRELTAGFDRIADALLAARQRYERVKRFDDALLGEDYEL